MLHWSHIDDEHGCEFSIGEHRRPKEKRWRWALAKGWPKKSKLAVEEGLMATRAATGVALTTATVSLLAMSKIEAAMVCSAAETISTAPTVTPLPPIDSSEGTSHKTENY